MIEQFKEDVKNLVLDYNRECKTSTLVEVTEYVENMLGDLGYNKKKHIFGRFIRQTIAQAFPDLYGEAYNHFIVEPKPEVVEFIGTIPQHEQRTEAWYAARKNSIGASESAAIFGMNPYETENKLILKKCGVINEADQQRMKAICEHGVKYEQIIQEMYSRDKNKEIKEFGSIPHQSEELSMVTASPDGITPDGYMLEIKAPVKREITGIPPPYYWVQCQQQMQVCKLDIVHFLEVKIQEYTNIDDYIEDSGEDKDAPYTSKGYEKGVIIEYHKLDSEDGDIGYYYPEKLLKTSEIKEWFKDKSNEINSDCSKQVRRLSYWKCSNYCLTEIYKDQEWWNENVHRFGEFWKKVLYHRENGYDDLLPKKRVNKENKKKSISCLIESDDEDRKPKAPNDCEKVPDASCMIVSDED